MRRDIEKLEKQLKKIYWEAEQGLLPNSVARVQSWAIIELIGKANKRAGRA